MNKSKMKSPILIAEIVLVLCGVFLLFLVLAIFAKGGIRSTDIIGYANVSINGLRSPPILNRYFNVFLLRLFIKLSPTPLLGIQYYWAFLISATCGLIYLAARLYRKKGNFLYGLLAVGLFLSISDIADTAGMPLIDVVTMFMVILFATLLIITARQGYRSFVLVGLLGFVFYLALRTKETSLPVGILFLGLGITGEEHFNWKVWIKRMIIVLVGLLLGVFFFILLNTIILHDPLFGFRLSDILFFIHTYVNGIVTIPKSSATDNWFTAYFFTSLLIPFVLYILSAVKLAGEQDTFPGLGLVWLVPLALIAFVTLVIGNQLGFTPRFIFPALPYICFLAPQFLNLDVGSLAGNRDRWSVVLIILIGLVLTVILRTVLRIIVPHLGWDIWSFFQVVYIPIMLLAILAAAFYWKQLSIHLSVILLVLIIGIISIPLVKNAKTLFRDQPNLIAGRELFYPFSTFQGQIHYSPEMKMFVSTDYWTSVGLGHLVKDRNEISGLFNVYFDVGSTRQNFILPPVNTTLTTYLLSTNFSYVLLSQKDWNQITQDQAAEAQLEARYSIIRDYLNVLVLLTLKSGYP